MERSCLAKLLGPENRVVGGDHFYLWLHDELATELAGDFEWFAVLYGIQPSGNISPKLDPRGEFTGLNVLQQAVPLGEIADRFGRSIESLAENLDRCLAKLDSKRSERPFRPVDGKLVIPANAAMIASLAKASIMTDFFSERDRDGYLQRALRAAEFCWSEAWSPNQRRLRHCRAGDHWI